MKVNLIIVEYQLCCSGSLPAVPRTKDQKITGLSIAKRFKALNMLMIYRKKEWGVWIDQESRNENYFVFPFGTCPNRRQIGHPLWLMTSINPRKQSAWHFIYGILVTFRRIKARLNLQHSGLSIILNLGLIYMANSPEKALDNRVNLKVYSNISMPIICLYWKSSRLGKIETH